MEGKGLGSSLACRPLRPAGCVPTPEPQEPACPSSEPEAGRRKLPERGSEGWPPGTRTRWAAEAARPGQRASQLGEVGKEDGEGGFRGSLGQLSMVSAGAGGQECRESERRLLHQEGTSCMKEARGAKPQPQGTLKSPPV